MKRAMTLALALAALALPPSGAATADDRQLVELPPHMQAHMMANMRDHLRALEEILAALAAGDVDTAGQVAERRIGMSSLEMHGARHMGPYMPPPMREIGTSLHRAASRFALVAQEADVEQSYEAQQRVFGALGEITAACNACHAAYRIR